MADGATESKPIANRGMILFSLMIATMMTAVDTTIANVALPHMAGTVSASADQITWVLTSYVIAAAIVTPLTGWLAGRFGKKAVFVVSIAGFTIASALCGAAQDLGQIVLFRLLQGMFGAALTPLSQSVILDQYTLEERGPIIAIWAMTVMVGPIVGPVLGGWLTDDFNWRWVFYINLPLGLISLLGVLRFFPTEDERPRQRFDMTGFALLSLALIAFQLFLDRGENNDWFHSSETTMEASVAGVAMLMFLIHTLMTDKPFLPLELFSDTNFITVTVISMLVGMLLFSVLALLPPITETLLGYPVITTGLVSVPRGIGALISMFIAGRLIGKIDARLIMVGGFIVLSVAFYQMSHFTLTMDSHLIIVSGFFQGLGTGFVFMPMNALAFATLLPKYRSDGTGVYTLFRNLGNSIGISIIQAIVTTNVQVAHSQLVQHITQTNPMARAPYLAAPFSLSNPTGLSVLNGEVTRQASMISYDDAFYLMFLGTIAMAPLLLILRPPKKGARAEITVDH